MHASKDQLAADEALALTLANEEVDAGRGAADHERGPFCWDDELVRQLSESQQSEPQLRRHGSCCVQASVLSRPLRSATPRGASQSASRSCP